MLCDGHHDRLDGQAQPRISVETLTPDGADGPLRWISVREGVVYEES